MPKEDRDLYEEAFTGNRDLPPWDNDPRTDEQIKQDCIDRMRNDDYGDDDHPEDGEE